MRHEVDARNDYLHKLFYTPNTRKTLGSGPASIAYANSPDTAYIPIAKARGFTPYLDKAAKLLEGIPGAIDKVSRKAVRAAVKGAKKEAAEKIADRYTIQKSRIGKTMRVAYRGAGAIFSSKGPVNDLSYFKHNPRSVLKHRPPKGQYLYSQVVKGQGGTIAHAFLAKMRSGHVGVFQRAGHGTSNASLPIDKLAGPSVPQMLGSPTIEQYMEKHLKERFASALEHETMTYLEGLHL